MMKRTSERVRKKKLTERNVPQALLPALLCGRKGGSRRGRRQRLASTRCAKYRGSVRGRRGRAFGRRCEDAVEFASRGAHARHPFQRLDLTRLSTGWRAREQRQRTEADGSVHASIDARSQLPHWLSQVLDRTPALVSVFAKSLLSLSAEDKDSAVKRKQSLRATREIIDDNNRLGLR